MRTTVCHKGGCYATALPGLHYGAAHRELEASWGKRPAPRRGKSTAWHHLYASARWRRESREFLAEYPACVLCGQPAKVVDHITPHRGDEALFWDKSNWQPLCWKHHSAKTLGENNFFREGGRGGKNISQPAVDQRAPSFVCTCEKTGRG